MNSSTITLHNHNRVAYFCCR
ncbi:MAG: TRASH domain-containing protein [Flavobacteriales bacterium]|nr:TRASH domain-containing protein [Flavobacteriales bacterium]